MNHRSEHLYRAHNNPNHLHKKGGLTPTCGIPEIHAWQDNEKLGLTTQPT